MYHFWLPLTGLVAVGGETQCGSSYMLHHMFLLNTHITHLYIFP